MTMTDARFTATAEALVMAELRGAYVVKAAAGEILARLSGKYKHSAPDREHLPVVGDIALCRFGESSVVIDSILPRKNLLWRRAVLRADGRQPIAANIDVVFIVVELKDDFNAKRIDRMLSAVRETRAEAVLLLTKPDLAGQAVADARTTGAGKLFPPGKIVVVNGLTGEGIEIVAGFLRTGKTACFIGSSGVGKSTVINRLAGRELLKTIEVRARDGKGRHATSARQMFFLPGGGAVIDTPGVREFGLCEDSEGHEEAFPEIEELALRCRFTDCRHENEPGCAVLEAVSGGTLAMERLGSYRKLSRETMTQELKSNAVLWHIVARGKNSQRKRMNQRIREQSAKDKPRG